MPVRIDVTVRNSGPAPEKRNMLLLVDDFGQPRQKEPVDLAARRHRRRHHDVVSFTHVFDKPGPHRVLVAVEGTDALDVDNTRRLAVQIADRIPVLCVKQRAGRRRVPGRQLLPRLRPGPRAGGGTNSAWPIRPVESRPPAPFDPRGPCESTRRSS